jgi:hypothetical protein
LVVGCVCCVNATGGVLFAVGVGGGAGGGGADAYFHAAD